MERTCNSIPHILEGPYKPAEFKIITHDAPVETNSEFGTAAVCRHGNVKALGWKSWPISTSAAEARGVLLGLMLARQLGLNNFALEF